MNVDRDGPMTSKIAPASSQKSQDASWSIARPAVPKPEANCITPPRSRLNKANKWLTRWMPGLVVCSSLRRFGRPHGHIDDVARPGSEWLRWRQTIGRLDVTAHLSVMPSAYGLNCNTLHRRKESGVGACVYRKPKRECNGDGVRQGWRSAEPGERPAHLYPMTGAF